MLRIQYKTQYKYRYIQEGYRKQVKSSQAPKNNKITFKSLGLSASPKLQKLDPSATVRSRRTPSLVCCRSQIKRNPITIRL
jgi:hypothetical protein